MLLTPLRFRLALGLLTAGLACLQPGCATVTRGTKDTLVIETDPPGATVWLDNGLTGLTPTSFKLPRKHDLTVHIAKKGYEPLTIEVKSQVSGAGGVGFAGNALIGGLIGAGVDLGTGAMKDLRPNPIKVNLVAIREVPKEAARLPIAVVAPVAP